MRRKSPAPGLERTLRFLAMASGRRRRLLEYEGRSFSVPADQWRTELGISCGLPIWAIVGADDGENVDSTTAFNRAHRVCVSRLRKSLRKTIGVSAAMLLVITCRGKWTQLTGCKVQTKECSHRTDDSVRIIVTKEVLLIPDDILPRSFKECLKRVTNWDGSKDLVIDNRLDRSTSVRLGVGA